jgi:fumarylpyruvate hydrolase
MTRLAFPRTEPPNVPVAGTDAAFPVRHVFCVTRNYDPRAAEPGGLARRDEPAIFTKQSHAVVPGGGRLPYPSETAHFEPEVELVVAIGAAVSRADAAQARAAIYGYAVGLDMTRRDLQKSARSEGKPWDVAKWFDGCAPVSAIRRVADIGHPTAGAITLDVNGSRAQAGDLAQMIWNAAEVVAAVSKYVTLAPGDLVFTGTPAGEATLRRGDRLVGAIAGVGVLEAEIV